MINCLYCREAVGHWCTTNCCEVCCKDRKCVNHRRCKAVESGSVQLNPINHYEESEKIKRFYSALKALSIVERENIKRELNNKEDPFYIDNHEEEWKALRDLQTIQDANLEKELSDFELTEIYDDARRTYTYILTRSKLGDFIPPHISLTYAGVITYNPCIHEHHIDSRMIVLLSKGYIKNAFKFLDNADDTIELNTTF